MENATYIQELCMKGTIRTLEKCPKCCGKFTELPLECSTCLTHPKRYFIDLYIKGFGRLKLYSDKLGRPLSSWETADRVLTRIRSEIDDHTFDPTKYAKAALKKFTFETRIDAWYKSKEAEKDKGNLSINYTRGLERYKNMYYIPHFKTMDVRDIRALHIQEFYEGLPSTLSLKYVKNILNALENFFNVLKRHDLIEKRPAFPVITVDRKTPKWIDRTTQIEVINLIPEEHRPIFMFLAFQGVRSGEARALKVKNVNFDSLDRAYFIIEEAYSGTVLMDRPKSKVVRPRAINPILIDMLKGLCEGKTPEANVFINPNTKKTYGEKKIDTLWRSARTTAKLDVTLYQATRHSLASNLLKDGAALKSIGDILGHTDIRTTLKYAHGDLDNQQIAFAKQANIIELSPQTVRKAKAAKK